jgi:hypothetical protein
MRRITGGKGRQGSRKPANGLFVARSTCEHLLIVTGYPGTLPKLDLPGSYLRYRAKTGILVYAASCRPPTLEYHSKAQRARASLDQDESARQFNFFFVLL